MEIVGRGKKEEPTNTAARLHEQRPRWSIGPAKKCTTTAPKGKTDVLVDFQSRMCYLGTIEAQYGTQQRKASAVIRIVSYISESDMPDFEALKEHLGAPDNSAAIRHLIAKGVERMKQGDTKERALARQEVMLTGMAHDQSVLIERVDALTRQAARTQAAVQMVLYLDYSKMAEPIVLQAGQVEQIREVIRQLTTQ